MMAAETLAIPADGVEFELTLESVDPLEMWEDDGNLIELLISTGSPVAPQTRKFMLVRVGYCANLNEVGKELAKHGSIPVGQWREAFRKAFPKNDGKGNIGFADPSWTTPSGPLFPVLQMNGLGWSSGFLWDDSGREEWWRWLVEVK